MQNANGNCYSSSPLNGNKNAYNFNVLDAKQNAIRDRNYKTMFFYSSLEAQLRTDEKYILFLLTIKERVEHRTQIDVKRTQHALHLRECQWQCLGTQQKRQQYKWNNNNNDIEVITVIEPFFWFFFFHCIPSVFSLSLSIFGAHTVWNPQESHRCALKR